MINLESRVVPSSIRTVSAHIQIRNGDWCDCVSFVRDARLRVKLTALTSDRHFEQAGFTALLAASSVTTNEEINSRMRMCDCGAPVAWLGGGHVRVRQVGSAVVAYPAAKTYGRTEDRRARCRPGRRRLNSDLGARWEVGSDRCRRRRQRQSRARSFEASQSREA